MSEHLMTVENLTYGRGPSALQAVRNVSFHLGRALLKRLPDARAIAQATGNRHFLGLFNYLGEVLVPRARVRAALRMHLGGSRDRLAQGARARA